MRGCAWQVREEGFGWKRRFSEHEQRLGTEAPEKKEKPRGKMNIWEVGQQLRAKAAQQTGGGNQTDIGHLAAPGSKAGEGGVSGGALRDDNMGNFTIMDEQPKAPEHISRTRKREIAALAAAGNVSACFELAMCHTYGMGGVERNPREALQWYQQAADLGHVDAMFRVGVCYLDGFGAPADNRSGLGIQPRVR